jgi:predicted transcriptional regulator
VDNVVGKFSTAESVDKSEVEVRRTLIEEMGFGPRRVKAFEVAAELGCSGSALSKYLNHGTRLPYGIGPESVRTAIRRVREKRGEVAA